MTRDEKMLKLAKMITDVVFHSTGLQKMDKKSWEYVGINSGLKFAEYKYDRQTADDVLDVCLSFGKRRKPLTFAQLKEKNLSGMTQDLRKRLRLQVYQVLSSITMKTMTAKTRTMRSAGCSTSLFPDPVS